MAQKNNKQSYYDETAKEVDPLQPAFTRRREAFVGRLAMASLCSRLTCHSVIKLEANSSIFITSML